MSSASVCSWESREAKWKSFLREHRGVPADGSSDEEGELTFRLPAQSEAGDRLFSYMIDLLESGSRVTARVVCVVGYWAALAGARGKFGSRSMHPQSSSGKFQKLLDVVMKSADSKGILYNLDLPGYSRSELGNSVITVPVAPAHERLVQDVMDDPLLPERLRTMEANKQLPTNLRRPPSQKAA